MRLQLRNLFVLPRARALSPERDGNGQVLRLEIDGLVCALCAGRVRAALAGLPGVTSARVDLATGTAVVRACIPLSPQSVQEAVQGRVIFPWARRLLATIPWLGRGQT